MTPASDPTCPNGHAIPASSEACPICGQADIAGDRSPVSYPAEPPTVSGNDITRDINSKLRNPPRGGA